MLIDSSKTLKNFGTGVVDPYLPPAALPLTPESIGTSVPTLSARKCRCSRLRPWSIRCLGNRWSLRLQTLGQWSHPCQQNHRLMADLTVRTLYNLQHPLSTTLIILYTFVVFVLLVFVVPFLYFLFVCCLVCFSFSLSPFYFFTKLSLVTSRTHSSQETRRCTYPGMLKLVAVLGRSFQVEEMTFSGLNQSFLPELSTLKTIFPFSTPSE